MLVSIIIISLNEAKNIKSTILAAKNAAKLRNGGSLPIEIILSDGGSTDKTVEIARGLVDKVINSPRGRSNQLNEGAKNSKGDILLFLHADTLLPKGAILRIYKHMKDSNAVGGGFKKYWNWNPKLKVSSFVKFLNFWWQGLGNWIVRLSKNYPGDNAVFVRREIFDRLKGFTEMWICEDLDFVKRLKILSKNQVLYIRSAVLTSTRRYENMGYLRLVILWWLIYWLWRFGISQKVLERRFKRYTIIPEEGNKGYLRV